MGVGVGVGVGVDVGGSSGVGVELEGGVFVASRVSEGVGVLGCVGVALDVVVGRGVTLGVVAERGAAIGLAVGMLVDEKMVGFEVRETRATLQASRAARMAIAPVLVRNRRRLNLRRGVFEGTNERLLVITSIIGSRRANVKPAR